VPEEPKKEEACDCFFGRVFCYSGRGGEKSSQLLCTMGGSILSFLKGRGLGARGREGGWWERLERGEIGKKGYKLLMVSDMGEGSTIYSMGHLYTSITGKGRGGKGEW